MKIFPSWLAPLCVAVLTNACGGGGNSTSTADAASAASSPAIPAPAGTGYLTRAAVAAVPAPTYTNPFQVDAFRRLNALRQSVGLGLIAQNDRLDIAASAHANYMRANGPGNGHFEAVGLAGYTGYQASDRLTAAGYSTAFYGGEDIAFTGDGVKTVNDLIDAVYHRIILLSFKPKDVGISYVQTSADPDPRFNTYVAVLELAYTGAGQGAPAVTSVVWPAENSTTSSVSMPSESPRPGLPGASGVFGYPVSISVDEDRMLVPTTFVLNDSSGAAVSANLLSYATDPNLVALGAKALVAIVPRDPLQAGTVYRARFVGTLDGVAYSRDWTFRTP